MSRTVLSAAAAAALLIAPSAAIADRDPTPEERSAIEQKLKDLGFTTWDDIEFDDDGSPHWEIDDARAEDGREFDVKLAPETLDEIAREED